MRNRPNIYMHKRIGMLTRMQLIRNQILLGDICITRMSICTQDRTSGLRTIHTIVNKSGKQVLPDLGCCWARESGPCEMLQYLVFPGLQAEFGQSRLSIGTLGCVQALEDQT